MLCFADKGAGLLIKPTQLQDSERAPSSENLDGIFCGVPITTMMLRNIPNKYSQNVLMQEIDSLGFVGTYDFLYMPMDMQTRRSVGYAFVNFETAQDAELFRQVFSEHNFELCPGRLGKVSAAHVQGLQLNLEHFENRAVTKAAKTQYRPVVLKGGQRVNLDDALERAKCAPKNASAGTCGPVGIPPAAPDATQLAWPCALSSKKTASGLVLGSVVYEDDNRNARECLEAAIRDLLASRIGCGDASNVIPAAVDDGDAVHASCETVEELSSDALLLNRQFTGKSRRIRTRHLRQALAGIECTPKKIECTPKIEAPSIPAPVPMTRPKSRRLQTRLNRRALANAGMCQSGPAIHRESAVCNAGAPGQYGDVREILDLRRRLVAALAPTDSADGWEN